MKVYFAAPLFSTAERLFNDILTDELRAFGHEVFLPQENQPDGTLQFVCPPSENPPPSGAQGIFDSDVRGIAWCEVVVAILDGSDPDSGTAWECGFAYAQSIPVIGVRTDFRQVGDHGGEPVNLTLTCSVRQMIIAPYISIDRLAFLIDQALKGL